MTNPTDLDSLLVRLVPGIDDKYVPITRKEAKASIEAIIARECDKARIEEVQNYLLDERDNHKHDLSYGYDRLAQLKAEAAQKGDV